jgi:hypothetical protein
MLFRDLVKDIEDQVAVVEYAVLRTTFGEQAEKIVPLRSTLIIMLTTKALTHHYIGFRHPDSRRKGIEAVRSIASAAAQIQEDEVDYLDPLLGVRVLVERFCRFAAAKYI